MCVERCLMGILPDFSLSGLGRDLKSAVAKGGEAVADAVTEPVQAVAGFAKDEFQDARQATGRAVSQLSGLGNLASTWGRIAHAVTSGETTHLPGRLPDYPTLDPQLKAEAVRAGEGRTIHQPLLSSDEAGKHVHDPVNLVVHGSREDLVKALETQGWVQASSLGLKNDVKMVAATLLHVGDDAAAPVSTQYLDGKHETMAFNKNSDHAMGRDHLRVYHRGVDPKTGEDIWAIAAIRDKAVSLTVPHPDTQGSAMPWKWDWQAPHVTHSPDVNIDGERDMVMDDFLKSGLVRDWAAVDGTLPPGKSKEEVAPGRYKLIDRYPTDGQVYEVKLGADPSGTSSW